MIAKRSARLLARLAWGLLLVPSVASAMDGVAKPRSRPPELQVPVPLGVNVVRLADGSWQAYQVQAAKNRFQLVRRTSSDMGARWSAAEVLRELPGDEWSDPVALLDRRGELQLFFLRTRKTGGERLEIAVNYFIDVWHCRSLDHATRWSEPQRIFEGYVGSAQGALQMTNGRLLFPFAFWIADRPSGPPTGSNVTTVLFSDDDGATWTLSDAQLTSPCDADFNGSNYGAIEPAVLQLRDGRVWMLIRTQRSELYESFSEDGEHWSDAAPSRIRSSSSPASLIRLPDDRIVMIWNHCEMPPRADGQGVYGGRDALHAAISADEGKTWKGCREIYRDPNRHKSPPMSGDRGTAYPFTIMGNDGRVGVISGQGATLRALIRLDPTWLLETHHSDDFSNGLETWSVFKGIGPAQRFWRDRTVGPQLVTHPDRGDARVLHVRRPDAHAADGAVWNFPAGDRGAMRLVVQVRPGFQGASLALVDRFFDPCDDRGDEQAMFRLLLSGDKQPQSLQLDPGRWHELELRWDIAGGRCEVHCNGGPTGLILPLAHDTYSGVSYLRLRSTAAERDEQGMWIERVSVNIEE
jgi:hypothetical protein